MGDLRAAAVETRREMMGRISGWTWQGRVMKGELDEGRSGGEEEGDKRQAGMGIASTRQADGKERGGEVRVSAKKETDLGVHIMQVRCVLWVVWSGMAW